MKALNRTALIAAVAGLFAVSLTSSAASAAVSYTVTDLGTLHGGYSQALGINGSGQVVGVSDGHAFLYSWGSGMIDLGTLGSGDTSVGYAINASGHVVGWSNTTVNAPPHAFRYAGFPMTDLGNLGGTYGTEAYGINASGQVVGYSYTPDNGGYSAFLYSDSMTDLGTLGGNGSQAWGINDNGQVVGNAITTGDLASHAFLYSSLPVPGMIDLGALGSGDRSVGRAINANGQVVGYSNFTNGGAANRAFFYSGSMIDLGTLGGSESYAYGINARAQVVGGANIAGDVSRAFLYSGSTMTDLNSLIAPLSGWTLTYAYGINDLGQIAGVGTISGQDRAFLLTPVPEPALLGLLALGVSGMLARRRDAGR